MNKIKHIYLSYWFHELDYNPSNKVFELEEEIRSIINEPLMYNDDKSIKNIIVPRIQGTSQDKKYLFTMSLINAILSIDINSDIDNDELVLLVNDNIQLFYDVIRKLYDIDILYTSIKVELLDEDPKSKKRLVDLLELSNNKYEDLSFKQGIIKDDYYINYILSYSKEYNFNFDNSNNLTEEDLFNKSMVTSLSDANQNREYLLTIVEINDRYAYNINSNHKTRKEDIRGMVIELKNILNKELYNKK